MNIIKIPLKALKVESIKEDKKESLSPEANDPVTVVIEGVVKSVSGEEAEVEVRFFNSERPMEEKEEAPDKESEESLEQLAAKADEEESY